MSMGANDPRGGAIFDPRGMVAGFIKRTTTHCYIQNMNGLGLVVSEKIFFGFSHDAPGAGRCCHGNQSSDTTWPKT